MGQVGASQCCSVRVRDREEDQGSETWCEVQEGSETDEGHARTAAAVLRDLHLRALASSLQDRHAGHNSQHRLAAQWCAQIAGCELPEIQEAFFDARGPSDGSHDLGLGRKGFVWTKEEILAAGVPADQAVDIASLAEVVNAVGIEPCCDPLTLLRFYIAREGNVANAASMYRTFMEWRFDYGIGLVMNLHGRGEHYDDIISPTREKDLVWRWERSDQVSWEAVVTQQYAFFGKLRKPNPVDAAPILVWRAGIADIAALKRENLTDGLQRALLAHLEDAFQTLRAVSAQQQRLIHMHVIIDVEGLGLTFLRHIMNLQPIFDIGFTHLPEMVKTVTLLRAPRLFTQFWRLLQAIVPPATLRKFRVLGADFEEGLKEHTGLEVAQLPKFLGGNVSDNETCFAKTLPLGVGAAGYVPRFHRKPTFQS